MTLPVRPYAALAVPSLTGIEPERFLRLIRDCLKRLDAKSGETPKASVRHSAVASDTLMVKIDTEIDPRAGARVIFRLAARPQAKAPSIDRSVEVLSDIVLHALQFVDASHVEWLDPRTRLSPEEFHASCSYVSPKRARREMVEAPITESSVCEIEKSLERMFQDNPPVTEPGHGHERAAKVAAARRAAQDTLRLRKTGPVPLIHEDGTEALPEDAIEAETVTPRTPRGAFLPRLLSRLQLRTVAHVTALGGTGVVFWKMGMFEPILRIVGT